MGILDVTTPSLTVTKKASFNSMVKMLGEGKNNGEVRSAGSLFYLYGDTNDQSVEFYAVDIVNSHLEARVIVNKADKGRCFRFKDDGSFLVEDECQTGNGQARLATNGDLYGSPWSGWLRDWVNNNFLPCIQNQDTIGTFALACSNTGNVDMNMVVSGSNLYPSTADGAYLDWALPGAC